MNCGLCELLCPEFAVYVDSVNGVPKKLTKSSAKKKPGEKSEEAPSHV